MILDALRFSVGTLTAIPVRPPATLERRVTVPGLALAPLAVLPLGALVAALLWAGRELGLAPLAVAALAVGALALGSRAFHLDGLADTADGLTSSYDAERALAVMRQGDTGPAGAAALVLVLGVQIGALVSLQGPAWGPLLAGVLVCASRGAVLTLCVRGVPSARRTGLAAAHASTAAPALVAGLWLLLAGALAAASAAAGLPWWRGPVCALVALAVLAWLTRRAVRRLGGITGDVLGAAVELSLAAMLLAAT